MKTIREALIDEIHYPISIGFAENVLIASDLDGDSMFTTEIARSNAFIGAKADCLVSLVEAPNFNEADKSFSLGDRNLILKRANTLYKSIGEDEVFIDRPMVYIGG